MVVTFESVDEILKCDHSNESYWAVFSCGTVYHAEQDESVDKNPKVWPFKRKLPEQHFSVVLFKLSYKVVLTFESVDDIF